MRGVIIQRGASPRRTPLHALARAAPPARSVRLARSPSLARVCAPVSLFSGGLRPAAPPCTLSRAPRRRRAPFAWLARHRSLASRTVPTTALQCHCSAGGFAPPHPPTRSRARRAAGALRSRGSLAIARSRLLPAVIIQRGASPRRTPLHALARAAPPARSVRVARSPSLARVCYRLSLFSGGLRPAAPPCTLSRAP